MNTHTPGPWKLWQLAPDSDPMERNIIVASDGETEITGIVPNQADARLIVAAPDLRNALIMAASFIENGESSGYTFFEVREAWRYALEKAETS